MDLAAALANQPCSRGSLFKARCIVEAMSPERVPSKQQAPPAAIGLHLLVDEELHLGPQRPICLQGFFQACKQPLLAFRCFGDASDCLSGSLRLQHLRCTGAQPPLSAQSFSNRVCSEVCAFIASCAFAARRSTLSSFAITLAPMPSDHARKALSSTQNSASSLEHMCLQQPALFARIATGCHDCCQPGHGSIICTDRYIQVRN